MIYGVEGVGKSTWAASSPAPIVLQTEDGLGRIEVARFPLAVEFCEVLAALRDLYREKHEYRTVVVDSVDWLERLIWVDVARDAGVESIDAIGYGRGYVAAVEYWKKILAGLEALRRDKDMGVVLVAHGRIESYQDPERESYSRHVPSLHKHAAALLLQWVDEIFFASWRVAVKKTDEGFGRTRGHGVGSGARIMRTEERPSHVAKNRLGLPYEMDLNWPAYQAEIDKQTAAKSKGAKHGKS
jgi:hypothetical protein